MRSKNIYEYRNIKTQKLDSEWAWGCNKFLSISGNEFYYWY